MINFIICDNNKLFSDKISNAIHNVMINNNEDYKIYTFKKCNSKLINLANNDHINIYILNIDTLNNDAFAIANQIRENDLDGLLTFYTDHLNYWAKDIIKSRSMFLSIINQKNIIDDLSMIITNVLTKFNKKNILQVKSGKKIYRINTNSILYITCEKMERHISIITDHEKFYIRDNLANISNMLDERFIYSHRSCIVNIERIRTLNKKSREITFDNGEIIDLVSFRSIKNLKNTLQ